MLTAVLDDDPTGTQSATGATVLLDWDTTSLVAALRDRPGVYLQTNSRAVAPAEAVALSRRTRSQLAEASATLGRPILPVLRGDSTLRGHVFAESDVFAGPTGSVLFVPAFPQGGRTTVDSVHRVVIDGVDTPVGETEFARDPVFGYQSSDLVSYVREKGDRRGLPVPLALLRSSGGAAVATALLAAGPGEFVLPDAVTDDDIHLVHAGLLPALTVRGDIVVRCAATLAAVCAGCLSASYLDRPLIAARPGVLIVCGSHTSAATAQLEALTGHLGRPPVEIPTEDALADPVAAGRTAARRLTGELHERGFATVSTERVRRPSHDSLAHGEMVNRALMTAASAVADSVGTVVSKGGITSAEVARTALGATRARVRGQLAAGISVWDYADGTVQVVVPGNVGGRGTLVDVISAVLGPGALRPSAPPG
jgi:uncharacterized protein YgbK (DUF1537 family)